MVCPKCGNETDASGKFCQWCGFDIATIPVKPVIVPEEEEGPEVGVYAGLCRRFIAFIVDAILILLIGIVLITFFSMTNCVKYAYYIAVHVDLVSSLTEAGTADAAFGPIIAALGMLIIIVPWLYFVGFELSHSQATPGKVLMHFMVTDMEGNKSTFARVTLRHFGKFISALVIFIGFLMIGLTNKRQGLHDKICNCLVLHED